MLSKRCLKTSTESHKPAFTESTVVGVFPIVGVHVTLVALLRFQLFVTLWTLVQAGVLKFKEVNLILAPCTCI